MVPGLAVVPPRPPAVEKLYQRCESCRGRRDRLLPVVSGHSAVQGGSRCQARNDSFFTGGGMGAHGRRRGRARALQVDHGKLGWVGQQGAATALLLG